MLSSGRWVGVFVSGVAICLCLLVCSLPEILTQKQISDAGSCHTDEDNQTDDSKVCCSRDAILPDQTCFSPVLDHDWTSVSTVIQASNDVQEMAGTDLLHLAPDPTPGSTVLRI